MDGRAYVVSIFHKGSTKPQQAFFSNSRFFIDKQQALFDQLWEIAIPIDLRDKELKLKESSNLIKTSNKIDEIQIAINTLMDNCKKKFIIFSSMNLLVDLTYIVAFWQKYIKLEKRNVSIKILTDGSTSELRNETNKLKKTSQTNLIQIEYSSKLGSINECVIISDGKSLLKINNDYNQSENFTGMLIYDPDQILIQEILFEKHWNEIENLTILNQKV